MAKIDAPTKLDEVPLSIIKNMISLATSGFGVVVALAWNDAIKAFVEKYINPLFGESGGTVAMFIYAVIVTLLAVFVTMQLAFIQRKFEEIDAKLIHKNKQEAKAAKKLEAAAKKLEAAEKKLDATTKKTKKQPKEK